MRLRFRIATPSNTGNPDYTICGQGDLVTPHINLAVKVTMEGIEVINEADLSNPTFPVSVVLPSGTVVDNIGIEDVEWIALNVNFGNIENQLDMLLEISKAGYFSYSNLFEIYGYDLGNNPNQSNSYLEPITYNPDFTIYLLTETDNLVNGKQTKAFASYIAYRKPFTKEIYYYKSNSGNYTINNFIYDNNGTDVIVFNSPNGMVCYEEDASFKMFVSLSSGGGGGDTCITSFVQIDEVNNVAEFAPSVSCVQDGIVTAGDLGFDLGTVDCTINLATNTAKTIIDYSTLNIYYNTDLKVYPYSNHRLLYALYNSSQALVSTKTVNYIFNIGDIWNPNLAANTFQFSIKDTGDYLLKVTLAGAEDNYANLIECWKNVPIFNYTFYTIEELEDCNQYRVNNKSFEDLILEVSEFDENRDFIVKDTITIPALSSSIYIVDRDGVYQFNIKRTVDINNQYGIVTEGQSFDFIFIIAAYCDLKSCIFEYLQKLLCVKDDPCCDDCKQDVHYNFNALTTKALTYFGMLQEEMGFNYMYTALTPNKLEDLWNLQTFLDEFQSDCDSCKLFNTNCGCS